MPELDQLALLEEATETAGPAYPGPYVESDEWKWRRLTESPRDLPSYKHKRAQEISEYLYRVNPLAHRILELTRDFVVGGGLSFHAEDEKIQKLLLEFWTHPRNQWPLKLAQRMLEYYLYGEQLWRVDVDSTGRSFTVAIPVLEIEGVLPDPSNPAEPSKVILVSGTAYAKTRVSKGRPKRDLEVVRLNLSPNSPGYTFREGDVFFFRNNPVTGALRGYPELLPLSDWLDSYDLFGYLRMTRASYLLTWFWDVTLEGYTEAEVDAWLAKNLLLRPTQPGSILAHNETVKWEPVTPKLEARDASSESQELRRIISTGAGYPMAYLGGGEQGRIAETLNVEPTYRTLMQKQEEVRGMISEVFNFVIDQAVVHGLLGINEKTDRTFTISLPRIALRDVMRIGGALSRISEALERAELHGWASKEQISKVFGGLVEDLAVQLPYKREEENKREEEMR